MEAYKVWVTLNLKGDALEKMSRFTAMAEKATAAVNKLKIAMRPNISMFDQMSVNLREINPQLNRMARNITDVENATKRLNRAKIASIGSGYGRIGAAAGGIAAGAGIITNPYVLAGVGITGGLTKGFRESASYESDLLRIQGQGFSAADVKKANDFAMKNSFPGISNKSMLNAVVDAAMATGSMSMATQLAPTLAKISFANKANFHGEFSALEENKLIRFAEMRGGSNPKAIINALNLGEQAYYATGGRMKPSELINFQTMAQSAGYSLTDAGFLKLAPIMQELGGFRSGTGLQTAFNRVVAGIGLVNKHNVTQAGKEGIRVGLLSNKGTLSTENALALESNPVDFFRNVVLPAYRSHGITSENQMTKENQIIFGRTGGRLFDAINKSLDKLERMLPLHTGAFGAEDAYLKGLNVPSGKVLALSESFNNFALALGKLTSPTILSGLDILTGFFNKLASLINFINGHSFNPLKDDTSLGKWGFSKIDLTAGSVNKNNQQTNVNVNLDGKILGTAVANHLGNSTLGHQFVMHGPTAINTTSAPIPTGATYLGGFG